MKLVINEHSLTWGQLKDYVESLGVEDSTPVAYQESFFGDVEECVERSDIGLVDVEGVGKVITIADKGVSDCC